MGLRLGARERLLIRVLLIAAFLDVRDSHTFKIHFLRTGGILF